MRFVIGPMHITTRRGSQKFSGPGRFTRLCGGRACVTFSDNWPVHAGGPGVEGAFSTAPGHCVQRGLAIRASAGRRHVDRLVWAGRPSGRSMKCPVLRDSSRRS
jgi:hypothetical protein